MTTSRSHAPGKGELTDRADSPASLFPQRGGAVQVSSPLPPAPTPIAATAWYYGASTSLASGVGQDLTASSWAQLEADVGTGLSGTTGGVITVGPAGAGRLVIVEASVTIQTNTGFPCFPHFRVELLGTGPAGAGVDAINSIFDLDTLLSPTGGVASHSHRVSANPQSKRVVFAKIAEEGDTFYLNAYQANDGGGTFVTVPGSSGSRRTYMRAFAVG